MFTDTARIHIPLDHLHALIENDPDLLDADFDPDLDDLERAFAELRDLLNH